MNNTNDSYLINNNIRADYAIVTHVMMPSIINTSYLLKHYKQEIKTLDDEYLYKSVLNNYNCICDYKDVLNEKIAYYQEKSYSYKSKECEIYLADLIEGVNDLSEKLHIVESYIDALLYKSFAPIDLEPITAHTISNIKKEIVFAKILNKNIDILYDFSKKFNKKILYGSSAEQSYDYLIFEFSKYATQVQLLQDHLKKYTEIIKSFKNGNHKNLIVQLSNLIKEADEKLKKSKSIVNSFKDKSSVKICVNFEY